MNFQSLREGVTHWVAARTAARWEKNIATSLEVTEVPVFLPLVTRAVQYASKVRKSKVPLFPGYVFLSQEHFTGNNHVLQACRSKIAQILKPPDYEHLRTELQAISDLFRDHELVQHRLYGKPGEPVEIAGGSFKGYTGTVLRLKPNRRQVVVQISFLGLAAEVEIEEHLVHKIRLPEPPTEKR